MKAVAICGLIVLTRREELLLARAPGERHWAIPMTREDAAKTPEQAAAEAFRAYTGLVLPADAALMPVGRYVYDRRTDLLLHALLSDRVDLTALARKGPEGSSAASRPEDRGALTWAPYVQVGERCQVRLARVLTGMVSASALLQRLARPVARAQAECRPPSVAQQALAA